MGLRQSRFVEKYTTDKISMALRTWEKFKNTDVPINSINSKLLPDPLFAHNNTAITPAGQPKNTETVASNTLKIKYRDMKTSVVPFLQHWFVDVNNEKRWHPGGDENIFKEITAETGVEVLNTKTSAMIELCDHCLYWYFYEKFIKDTYFDLFFFNCEIITGHAIETGMLWASGMFFVMFLFLKYSFFIIIAVILLAFFILMTKIAASNIITIYRCAHIHSDSVNFPILTGYHKEKNN